MLAEGVLTLVLAAFDEVAVFALEGSMHEAAGLAGRVGKSDRCRLNYEVVVRLEASAVLRFSDSWSIWACCFAI